MRLIDADSLHELLRGEYEFHKKLFDENGDRERGGIVRGLAKVSEMICKQPTIDAEPVVRCRDCKYAHLTYAGEVKYCDVWSKDETVYLDGDYYCASGEKK